jgi:transcriptional regulator with XRE-family HTH domain
VATVRENQVDILVGAAIRRRRIELRISQDLLARKLGFSYQQMQKYETGKNRISASRLFEIAHVLETRINYFFAGLSGVPEAAPPKLKQRRADAADLMRRFDMIEDPVLRNLIEALVERIGNGR